MESGTDTGTPLKCDDTTLSETIKEMTIETNKPSTEELPKDVDQIIHRDKESVESKDNKTDVEKRQDRLSSSSKQRCSMSDVTLLSEVLRLPRVNCKEKIVFVLHMSQELENPTFRSRSGEKFPPLHLIKRSIAFFMMNKRSVNIKHEFALIILQRKAHWALGFTSDPNEIISYLDDLDQTFHCDKVDLTSVFDIIMKNIPLPKVEENSHILPPPYIVRAIWIYGSSYCVPEMENTKSQMVLQSSPHFYIDAFYIHENPTDENKCEEIFQLICSLDTKGLSYVFEVSRNPTKLYDCMAQLLPHPLQRPIQDEAFYVLESSDPVIPSNIPS